MTERAVEFGIRKGFEVDVGHLDETSQLACGDGVIYIRIAVHLEFITANFIFLGQARHHRHADHVFALAVNLFSKIGFCDSTEHLLRRFCRGRKISHFRELVLEEVHPCRAAGGEDRKRNALVTTQIFGQTADKLGTLFHDGQVGGPVSVEHIVEAEGLESGGQLACSDSAGFHAEFFADGHTHSGSHLDDGLLGRIHDGAENSAGVVNLGKSAHRTYGDTLAAEGTR